MSPTQIRLALRVTSDYGNLTPEADRQWRLINALISHFNGRFQLYERKVVIDLVRGQGRYVDELMGYGREQACIDAARLSERGYFGILAQTTTGTGNIFEAATEPFSRCAAEHGLFVPRGALYYPERDYAQWHPYVWGLSPHCERVADNMLEYLGRRLGTRPARWAGDPQYRTAPRVYGLYHPDNDSYRWCADRFIAGLDEAYGIKIKTRFAYRLELGLLDSQALSAAAQFKREGVSTIILANDPRSQASLTNAADSIEWHPEWVNIGVSCQDCHGAARRYNQNQAHGHMFGPSSGASPQRDANAEAYRAIHDAGVTDAEEADLATNFYYPLVDMFNKLQVAGPHLSAANIARGLAIMPARGSPTSAWGRWSYRNDHTAVEDWREVYWHRHATSWDGKKGAWLMTYGGRRFAPDAWPTEEPPIYP